MHQSVLAKPATCSRERQWRSIDNYPALGQFTANEMAQFGAPWYRLESNFTFSSHDVNEVESRRYFAIERLYRSGTGDRRAARTAAFPADGWRVPWTRCGRVDPGESSRPAFRCRCLRCLPLAASVAPIAPCVQVPVVFVVVLNPAPALLANGIAHGPRDPNRLGRRGGRRCGRFLHRRSGCDIFVVSPIDREEWLLEKPESWSDGQHIVDRVLRVAGHEDDLELGVVTRDAQGSI